MYPPRVIIEKAVSCYNYVRWNKYKAPDNESNKHSTTIISGMKNKKAIIKNYILHRDNSLTIIFSDNYYIKFTEQ